jgi:small subunit ribosomal protein MRP21
MLFPSVQSSLNVHRNNDIKPTIIDNYLNVSSTSFADSQLTILTTKRSMELRRAADALLRANASPLSTLLAPSSTIRWATHRQLISRHASASPLQRTFITSSRRNAIRPQVTTSAPPITPESESSTEGASNAAAPKKDGKEKELAGISSSLWAKKSRASPTSANLLKGFSEHGRSAVKPSGFDTSRMMDVPGATPEGGLADIGAEMMSSLASDITPMPGLNKVPLRLNPSMGRHQLVSDRVDVGRAFQLVEMSCGRNKVRKDMNTQRFHERPGLKRKRLRRERWRTRFLDGFKATVNRVKQLKHQGW